jgi:hypothetical protein
MKSLSRGVGKGKNWYKKPWWHERVHGHKVSKCGQKPPESHLNTVKSKRLGADEEGHWLAK